METLQQHPSKVNLQNDCTKTESRFPEYTGSIRNKEESDVTKTSSGANEQSTTTGVKRFEPPLDTGIASMKSPIPTASSTTLSAEPHLYDDYDWCDLPDLIQDSFKLIGYTQEMWDTNGDPETCDKYFCELSPEQQIAAAAIGYDAELWDNEDGDSSDDDSEDSHQEEVECSSNEMKTEILRQSLLQLPQSPEGESHSDSYSLNSSQVSISDSGEVQHCEVTVRQNFDHYAWAELPEHVKEACKVLEYTEELWDSNQEPEAGLKEWHNLTVKEQEAAATLFYDAETWNDESDGNNIEDEIHTALDTRPSAGTTKNKGQGDYEEHYWRELPETVKKAAELLGYTEELWNRNKDPKRCRRSWVKLSSDEQKAAMTLGYDEQKWDYDDNYLCSGNRMPISSYEDMDWDSLPQHSKAAFKILGYTETTWNEDKEPKSCDNKWNALRAEEQEAARKAGFSAKAWDCVPRRASASVRIRKEIARDVRGSSYVVLDCLSMSAFFCVVDEGFGLAEKYVGEFTLNALKIVAGLLVMRCNGQMLNWLDEDDEQETPKRRKRKRKSMFNSFLNLLSWWTIYSGVNYFFDLIEDDYLHDPLKAWYEGIETMAKHAYNVEHAAAADDFTCSDLQQYGITSFHRVFGGMICNWNEEKWGIVSHFYYAAVFLFSAFGMFWLFEDNFLESCDEM